MRLPARYQVITLGLLLLAATALFGPWSTGRGEDGIPSGAATASIPQSRYAVPDNALFVAPDGSDSATGSKRNPLRTISTAVRRSGNGRTIVLRGGTYRESVGIVRKRLTIQPYPGEEVRLKGSVIVDDWKRTPWGWRHDGWNPRFCRDCYIPEIIDPAHPLAGLPDMVFVDGRPLRQVNSRKALDQGDFFVDTDTNTLHVGSDPTSAMVEAAMYPWLLQFDGPHAAGSTIRGVGIAHYATRQDYGQRGAMVVVNAPRVTLENNLFASAASAGVAVFRPQATIHGNTFENNGLVGLMANRADGLRLTGNRFTNNNTEHFALSGPAIGAAGVKITRTEHPEIRHNAFVANNATGWWCDLGCTDAVVVGNISRANSVHGLYYEVSARAVIASNLVLHNGGRGLKISSSDHVRVHHNTFSGNRGSVGIYNDKRSPKSDPYSHGRGLTWITARIELLNNYFAGTADSRPFVVSADYKPANVVTPAFISRSDGNAYLRGKERFLAGWYLGSDRTVRFGSLAELTRRTGHGEHSIATRRQRSPFRAPKAGDYRLRAGAPGASAGIPTPEQVARIVGVEPREHPDIGLLTRAGPSHH